MAIVNQNFENLAEGYSMTYTPHSEIKYEAGSRYNRSVSKLP